MRCAYSDREFAPKNKCRSLDRQRQRADRESRLRGLIKGLVATAAMVPVPSVGRVAREKKMAVFKDFTFAWWQLSLLKLSMVALGLAIGSTWPEVFAGWRNSLLLLFVVPAFYVSYVWLKQI